MKVMEGHKISYPILEAFVRRLFAAAGVAAEEIPILTRVFLWSDLVGRYNHGLRRIGAYLKRFDLGILASPCKLVFEESSPCCCRVDGGNGFGQYVGHVAMERAISLAASAGAGVVAVRNSNNYGVGAYYAQLAAASNHLGIALSNSFPKVAPHGGVEALLGTNPFSFAAPRRDKRSLLVDFSTGAAAGSTISRAIENREPLPPGIAIRRDGTPITDPREVAAGTMLPFAGAKGFGIGLMIEVFCGVLAGAGISREVTSMFQDFSGPGNHGHLFIALDIKRFMDLDAYLARMDHLVRQAKGVAGQPGIDEIRLPGERRWQCYERQMREGVLVEGATLASLNALAEKYAVPPLPGGSGLVTESGPAAPGAR